ncbi:hypothetical protein [Candidatus Protofrankia californiensis]|nr:hypothetical protein [Candidatus Protofrankia californiensis]
MAPVSVRDEPDLAQLLAWARAEPGADPAASLPDLLAARRRTEHS